MPGIKELKQTKQQKRTNKISYQPQNIKKLIISIIPPLIC